MVTWAAGAVVNVVGSLCINLGQNLMSAGHRARSASNATGKELPSIRKYRKWQIGVTIFAVGNVCNFGSFALAAQSLLAALGSVQFIANIIFGRIVLKEKVTKQVLLATALIVAGCVILVSFGNHTSDVYTSAELQSYYRKTPYIIYMASMVAGVVVSYLIFRHGNKQRIHRKQTMTNVSPFWRRVLPLTYCTFAGLVGTQSVLFCKTLSSLLRTSISGKSQFGSWFLYLNLFLFIIVAAFWVQRLNTGLLLFPTVVIVPLLQISWTLFSIFTGLVYFSEYKTFTTLKAAMFGLGVTVVVLGIMVLTHSRSDPYADVEAEELNQEKSLSRTTSGQSHSSTLIRDGSGQDDLGEALQKVSISSAGSHSSNISRKTSEPASPRPSKGPRLLPQPLDTSFFQDVVADFSLSLKSTGRQIIGLGGDKPVSIFSMPMTDIHPPNQSEASPLRLTPIHDIEMQGTLPNPEPFVETLPMSTPPKPAPRFRIRNPFAGGGLGSDGETDDDSPVAEPAARSPFDAPDRDERKFSSPNPAMSPAGREGIATRRTAMVQLGADDNPMSPTWDEPHDSARVQLSPQGGSNALFGGLLSPRALLSRRQGYAELEEQNTDARKDP